VWLHKGRQKHVTANTISLISKRKITRNRELNKSRTNLFIECYFKRDVDHKGGRKFAVMGRSNEDKNQCYSVAR
jgi:hypothetical protein